MKHKHKYLVLHYFSYSLSLGLLFSQTVLKGLAKTFCLIYTTGFFSRACISMIVLPLILYPSLLLKSLQLKDRNKALSKYFLLKGMNKGISYMKGILCYQLSILIKLQQPLQFYFFSPFLAFLMKDTETFA